MRRPLLLGGFMATGKSTVGRLVAEREGVPFVDLDARVEQRAGTGVARIFHERGEAAFRALESQELAEVLDGRKGEVVALGGGALTRRAARLDALDRAVVVTLEAPLEELLRRARLHGGRPLLDVPDPADRISELLEQRRLSYLEAHARIDTGGVDPAEVAAEVAEVWRRDPVAVAAGERSYAVEIGRGVAAERAAELVRGASMALLVTDSNVVGLHAAPVEQALAGAVPRVVRVVLDAGEQHKTVAALERIWREALRSGADRRSAVVALGGGVVSDVAGFAAATWMRGIRWVAIPSTLLSMVDASVGGKTAVDLESGKNLVGAFWQPSGVVCDVALLATEPGRGYTSALAEVVKSALIGDPELFALLEDHCEAVRARDPELVARIVRRSVRIKARVVALDEREKGLRATLNLGHTVGHALESQGGYSRLTHGEAVSLGLVAALAIGERLGHTSAALTARTVGLLQSLGLPCSLEGEPFAEAAELIGLDKKRSGAELRFVVARAVGRVETVDIAVETLRELVRSLA